MCADWRGQLRIIVGAALLLASIPARAADFPSRNYYTVPASLGANSWAGPYVAGIIGYQWGAVSHSATRPSGAIGGIAAGYNWQFGQFVVGGETDLQASGASDTVALSRFSSPWFGTVRGRAGVVLGDVLLFGTAGLAYGALTAQTPTSFSETRDSIGFVAGLGAEFGFMPHWSARAEWLYLDLADRNYTLTGTSNGLAANLLRLGLSYHF